MLHGEVEGVGMNGLGHFAAKLRFCVFIYIRSGSVTADALRVRAKHPLYGLSSPHGMS